MLSLVHFWALVDSRILHVVSGRCAGRLSPCRPVVSVAVVLAGRCGITDSPGRSAALPPGCLSSLSVGRCFCKALAALQPF